MHDQDAAGERPVEQPTQSGEAGPVVIYRLGSLGDTVVALPCLHKIAQQFPDSERIALTNFPVNSKASALDAILGDSGLIHRSVAYPIGLRSVRGLYKLRQTIRRLDARILIYLTPARGRLAAWRDLVFFRLCGFTRIIGLPLDLDLQRNRIDAEGQLEREYSRLARCLAPLGDIDLEAASSWDLRINDVERAAARSLLSPLGDARYFAINMGGKVAKNDWGIDNWKALLDRLADVLEGYGLLILGGADDDERAVQIGKQWSGIVVNACGRANPRISGTATQGASLFIGHDSGPLHLAACVGTRCVGLFGDNNPPRKWHPAGPGHQVIHKMEGVMSITVEEVVAAVRLVKRGLADVAVRSTS